MAEEILESSVTPVFLLEKVSGTVCVTINLSYRAAQPFYFPLLTFVESVATKIPVIELLQQSYCNKLLIVNTFTLRYLLGFDQFLLRQDLGYYATNIHFEKTILYFLV